MQCVPNPKPGEGLFSKTEAGELFVEVEQTPANCLPNPSYCLRCSGSESKQTEEPPHQKKCQLRAETFILKIEL